MKKMIAAAALFFAAVNAAPALAYNVQPGDTAHKIARNHKLTPQELEKLNPQINDFSKLAIGTYLYTNRPIARHDDHLVEIGPHTLTKEQYYLAKLVRAEAEGEPFEGKVAVAQVVLNRVDSDDYPYTIRSVIDQPGQFTPVENKYINKPADIQSVIATVKALKSDRSQIKDVLYFYNPLTTRSRWLDDKQHAFTIGKHAFMRNKENKASVESSIAAE